MFLFLLIGASRISLGNAPVPDAAGPICPSAVPVRVACFGDSLTAGDAKLAGAGVEPASKLGSNSVFSCGSYPRVLAGVLGPRGSTRCRSSPNRACS